VIGIGILFLLLSLYAAALAAVPRWRGRWRWGRLGHGPPISAFGFLGIALLFLLVGGRVTLRHFELQIDDSLWSIAVIATFLYVLLTAVIDSLRDRKSRQQRP